MYKRFIWTYILCMHIILIAQTQAGSIFCIQSKTNNANAPVYCDAPTSLFEINPATQELVGYGNIKVDGVYIRADGLAINSFGKMVAFIISDPANDTAQSTLILIDTESSSQTDITACSLGDQQDYFATAAAYDNSNILWVIDNISGLLHQINDLNGEIISSVTLTGGGYNASAVNSVLDLSFDSQNIAYVVGNSNLVWTLDVTNGQMTAITGPALPSGLCGAAVNPSDDDEIYAFRTWGGDDTIYSFSVAGQTIGSYTYYGTVREVTGNEGGRGDMAVFRGDTLIQYDMVYGIQTAATNDAPLYSTAPTAFFEINLINNHITSHGMVTLESEYVCLDALAINSQGRALAFALTDNSGIVASQMVLIDNTTLAGPDGVEVVPLGTEQSYFAAAAAFDKQDNLWLVDNQAGQLLKINDSNGSIIATYNLSGTNYYSQANNIIDLTFDSQNNAYLIGNSNKIWSLDTSTGQLTYIATPTGDTSNGLVGCAFSNQNDDRICVFRTFDGNDTFGIYSLATNSYTSMEDVTSATDINGGRGDLASNSNLLYFTSHSPAHNDEIVPTNAELSWNAYPAGQYQYNIYIGTTPALPETPVSILQDSNSLEIALDELTVYYWRVDIVLMNNVYTGPIWSFETGCDHNYPGDIDNNCGVDIIDLKLMAENWLICNLEPSTFCP